MAITIEVKQVTEINVSPFMPGKKTRFPTRAVSTGQAQTLTGDKLRQIEQVWERNVARDVTVSYPVGSQEQQIHENIARRGPIQLWVKYVGDKVPAQQTEDDSDMIDFGDIGGVYNSVAAAGQNVTLLNQFFQNVSRPAIRFGGISTPGLYNGKRVASKAYFNGTITVPSGKPVEIDGGNSRLVWVTITGTTPAISVESSAASLPRYIHSFEMESNGSGILLTTAGRGTILRNIRMAAEAGLGQPCTGVGSAVSTNLFATDLDTASYGIKLVDSDGVEIEGVAIMRPSDYGILIKGHLNAGKISARLWGSTRASGIKGENISGTQMNIVCESNYDRGQWFDRCGMSCWNGSSTQVVTDIPNDWWIWNEANKGRVYPPTTTGHKVRQGTITKTGASKIGGFSGWGSNKMDVDEGTRNSCIFEQSRHITQSYSPVYDLNQEDELAPTFLMPHETASPSNNNWGTVWTVNTPTVSITGSQGTTGLLITFPANSLQQVTGATAYWRPWGLLSPFSDMSGDVYIYEMELEGSTALANWCTSNDTTNSTIVVTRIDPFASAGLQWVGLYNTQPRKVMARCTISTTVSGIATPAFAWDPGLPAQSTPMTLSIKSLKFWGIRAAGGEVS